MHTNEIECVAKNFGHQISEAYRHNGRESGLRRSRIKQGRRKRIEHGKIMRWFRKSKQTICGGKQRDRDKNRLQINSVMNEGKEKPKGLCVTLA